VKDKPSIFRYLDYRAFLKDQFVFLKSTIPSYSFRTFSRIAGFNSPNFLKLVYDGKRNLSRESVSRIAQAFRLSKSEASFLGSLVQFNQAKTAEEKNQCFESMSRHQQYRKIQQIVPDQFEYYSKPFHIALRELVATSDFKEDSQWISERLRYKVSVADIEAGIDLLLKLGLLGRRDGVLVLAEPTMTTASEVSSLAILNYHKQMLKMAEESLDELKGADRDISSVTVTVNREQMKELKKRVTDFRNSVLAWLDSSSEEKTEVIQVNIQVFPLTRRKKGGAL